MNKEQALLRLKSMKEDYLEYGPQKDSLALEYAINELERTAQEVPVQEQYVTLKIDSTEIARVVIDKLKEQRKESIRTLSLV
ncbi:MAG: hypothetical protein E6940_10630 [Clostridium septicum]|uniref:hypothetical protein n=1 Tax=Clostridium septicum TaxID=1504 RepID=UPI002583379B|nr:hypothetical protein [Clostridium septicum]MDU1314499.1 hypothetical protein [Clostridium septicum]